MSGPLKIWFCQFASLHLVSRSAIAPKMKARSRAKSDWAISKSDVPSSGIPPCKDGVAAEGEGPLLLLWPASLLALPHLQLLQSLQAPVMDAVGVVVEVSGDPSAGPPEGWPPKFLWNFISNFAKYYGKIREVRQMKVENISTISQNIVLQNIFFYKILQWLLCRTSRSCLMKKV